VKLKSETTEAVTFLAAFPDVQGQMKIGRDGLRLVWEVPESEIAAALRLVLWSYA
jgi:hypothetical protein